MLPGIINATAGQIAGAAITTASGALALESLLLVNEHVFYPAMEYATKSVWGAFGQDPLRTELELLYARQNYFEPAVKWVNNMTAEVKNKIEELTGLDLDRDGGVGAVLKILSDGDKGQILNPNRTGMAKGSGTIKTSDAEPTEPTEFRETVKEQSRMEKIRTKLKNSPDYDEQLFNLLTGMTTA